MSTRYTYYFIPVIANEQLTCHHNTFDDRILMMFFVLTKTKCLQPSVNLTVLSSGLFIFIQMFKRLFVFNCNIFCRTPFVANSFVLDASYIYLYFSMVV